LKVLNIRGRTAHLRGLASKFEVVALAGDLIAWTQTLAFERHQLARRWEPKRFRFRLLAVAGGIIRTGRRRRLRLPQQWPWNHLITAGWASLRTA
jgi:hypothetical protein